VTSLGGVAALWVFPARDALMAVFYMDSVAEGPRNLWSAIFHISPILSLQTGLPVVSFRYLSSLSGNTSCFLLQQLEGITSSLPQNLLIFQLTANSNEVS
jgi:hypothetical protein